MNKGVLTNKFGFQMFKKIFKSKPFIRSLSLNKHLLCTNFVCMYYEIQGMIIMQNSYISIPVLGTSQQINSFFNFFKRKLVVQSKNINNVLRSLQQCKHEIYDKNNTKDWTKDMETFYFKDLRLNVLLF